MSSLTVNLHLHVACEEMVVCILFFLYQMDEK